MSIEEWKFDVLNNPSSEDLDFLTHKINKESVSHGTAY